MDDIKTDYGSLDDDDLGILGGVIVDDTIVVPVRTERAAVEGERGGGGGGGDVPDADLRDGDDGSVGNEGDISGSESEGPPNGEKNQPEEGQQRPIKKRKKVNSSRSANGIM